MDGSAEGSLHSLHISHLLLSKLEEGSPLPDVLKEALEALIRLSGSRFAFLLHNHTGSAISDFSASDPQRPADHEHLTQYYDEILNTLLPQMRRSSLLIANSSTAVKSELANSDAWRIFQRLLLIPLYSVTGDKKGILVLFGKPENYPSATTNVLSPVISLCINLLILDEQQPKPEHERMQEETISQGTQILHDRDYRLNHSKDPVFITTADGVIVQHNSAANNLLAFPSEQLIGQPISQLIPNIKLNLHPTQDDSSDFQELKAHSKSGKLIAVRASHAPIIRNSELLFSVQVQDIRAEVETKTERHERLFRIQKQQRATLEVARIATQEEAPFSELVRRICQITATTLKTPRAGIWLSEEQSPVYRNIIQIDRNRSEYCESMPLLLNSQSAFVRQLEQVRVLALNNLNNPNPGNSFLSADYLQQNQTATLICAAFIKNSTLIGFLIVEDTQHVAWQEDQYSFIREVANYLHILVLNEYRQKIQNDLAQQEQQFRLLFFDSPLAMMAFDQESFQFIAVNHTATEVFGYTLQEMLSKGIYDLIPIQQVMHIHALVSNHNTEGNYHVLESQMQKHSGTMVDVEIHAHTITLSSRPAILMVVHDITEKKRIDSTLRRTQKMEAVGQLVGGIAHDFNNITNIIKGHTELLEMKVGDEKTIKHINAIHKAVNRTTSLTHKLMQFSRQQQINSEVCNTGEILHDLSELITKSLTNNIQIELEIADDTWPTLIDRGDFEDVMINLAINARDAMDGHGTLTITTANCHLPPDSPLLVRKRQPGDYVCISLQDTGSGIPKELQDKIFDPFFTTKEKGKGTGLGLSMVYGFVKRSGGFLELESQENVGTTFYLWLPRSQSESGLTTDASSRQTLGPSLQITTPHDALVVDDEEDIRTSLSETLSEIGFNVIQAESADQARELIGNADNSFSLLLSDIVMPGQSNGVDLAQFTRDHSPDTRVILASGYAENISLEQARNVSSELLTKPFGRNELIHILSKWTWQ